MPVFHRPVFRLHCFNPLQQSGQQLLIGQFINLLTLFKDHTPAVAAGNADIRLTGFTGSVYDAAHNGNRFACQMFGKGENVFAIGIAAVDKVGSGRGICLAQLESVQAPWPMTMS